MKDYTAFIFNTFVVTVLILSTASSKEKSDKVGKDPSLRCKQENGTNNDLHVKNLSCTDGQQVSLTPDVKGMKVGNVTTILARKPTDEILTMLRPTSPNPCIKLDTIKVNQSCKNLELSNITPGNQNVTVKNLNNMLAELNNKSLVVDPVTTMVTHLPETKNAQNKSSGHESFFNKTMNLQNVTVENKNDSSNKDVQADRNIIVAPLTTAVTCKPGEKPEGATCRPVA